MHTPTLRFIRRGQPVALGNVPPDRTLLEVLREDLNASGTKEGCGEGDCGACTVVVAENDGGALRFRAINSCIRLAHSIDGMALWTVEDLAADPSIERAEAGRAATGQGDDARLHPVQEAMVACHASQCGFCTPGFVMSLFGLYQNDVCHGRAVTRESAQDALSGNLCRCTGYRPILDAAESMGVLPRVAVDEAAVLSKLELLAQAGSGLQPDSVYLLPRTEAQALAARAADPQAQVVAGCTDAGLWVTKQHRRFAQVLDVTRVAEWRRMERGGDGALRIGSAVPLADAFDALVATRPQLDRFAARFAGLPVRNSGTLGGNIANGSPIGDSMPLLIALGATVTLASVRGARTLALEDLYTGYRTNVMAADELLAFIDVPAPYRPRKSEQCDGAAASKRRETGFAGSLASPLEGGRELHEAERREKPGVNELLRAYKISKRTDDDISAVCLVICIVIADGNVALASIGAGGVAATPARARRTEAALTGQPWTLTTVRAATAALQAEFTPISDMRASGAYRAAVLGNLLQRFWLESQGQAVVTLDAFGRSGLALPLALEAPA